MRPVAWIMRGFLILYWAVRPFLMVHSGKTCRFIPTCSVYCAQAVTQFGVIKGGWLALKRLARCHPWGGEGVDFCEQSDRLAQDFSEQKK